MFVGRIDTLILLFLTSDDNTSPLVLVKLYKSSNTYRFIGSEVWNDLKDKDLLLLNRLQRFVAKHAQKFNTLTRSYICESMAG